MVPAGRTIFTGALPRVARPWARAGYFGAHDWTGLDASRVALVACHWIGDTFWATQVLGPLTARFPRASVFAVTKPAAADLWHGLLPPERVLLAPEVVSDRHRERVDVRALDRRARVLARQAFDLAIDLTGNRYSAFFTFRLKPVRALGFGGGELGWLYSFRVRYEAWAGRHLSERAFRVIEPLLSRPPDPTVYRRPPRPPVPTCPPEEVCDALGLGPEPVYVLAPGAGWPAKVWSPDRFVAVGARLAREGSVIVTGSPEERAVCERVARAVPGARLFLEPIGRLSALLARTRGVLANDSGVGHLGAAFGCRVAAVFTGATDPATFAPIGPAGRVRVFDATAGPELVARALTTDDPS